MQVVSRGKYEGVPWEEFFEDFDFGVEEHAEDYLDVLLAPLRESGKYVRREMPQADAFSEWFGLNTPAMLEAKTRAGMVTSIYRQIGIGCERLMRRVIQDNLGVPASSCSWAHVVEGQNRSLDARIPLESITARRNEFEGWICEASAHLGCGPMNAGAVFEVRQGHKSGDSKRQVGDRLNAAKALSEGYLPVMLVVSTQIPEATRRRYIKDGWLVLTGRFGGGALRSSYAFFADVLGFDLAGFLEDHQVHLKELVQSTLSRGMTPHSMQP
jgi:hypothetical protein